MAGGGKVAVEGTLGDSLGVSGGGYASRGAAEVAAKEDCCGAEEGGVYDGEAVVTAGEGIPARAHCCQFALEAASEDAVDEG